MPVEICTVGGYEEIGKNCTAIRIDEEVVIFDMGIYLDKYIEMTENEDIISIPSSKLMKKGAISDISAIDDWKDMVKAIIPTHAHLDHVGAIPFLASRFKDAPILCTDYTAAVINTILKDENMSIPNEIKVLTINSRYKISDNITVDFINMTHSTVQVVMAAIHTPYGVILYSNDFKFDSTPVLGKKPNFRKLKELGKEGIFALIVDSTYAQTKAKTPSESVAKAMLKEVMLGTESEGKAVLITTFSSHLARLKSIIEFGKQMNRKIIFFGRSLAKYVKAGEDIGIINFSKDAQIMKFKKNMVGKLKEVNKNRGKYILVVTGHQAEPKAVLSKIVRGETPFELKPEDQVIFSCKVIPTEMNEENRKKLENSLENMNVRIFKDVHVSGHAAREDLRDLINMVNPEHIIPAHGKLEMREALMDLALEMGYNKKKVHLSSDKNRIILQ